MTEQESTECPSCAVLSRQYQLVVEQNAKLAAQLRETESALARVYVSLDSLKNAIRERDAAGGGE